MRITTIAMMMIVVWSLSDCDGGGAVVLGALLPELVSDFVCGDRVRPAE